MKTTFKYYSFLLQCCLLCIGTLRAQAQHWQCDPYAWEYDMSAYVTLNLNNKAVDNLADYEIAAFCDGECRGVATIQSIEKDGETNVYGYLRIRSTQRTGEIITFKAYDSVSGKEYNVEAYSLLFQSLEVIGIPSRPIPFSILDDCNIAVTSSDVTKGMAECRITVKYGVEVTISATPCEGYHFVNWTVDDVSVSTDAIYTFAANGDISLVANFAPNQYTMTFVLDNGEENILKTQDYGTELTVPPAPTKTGFTFKGWNPEVPATIPAGNQTFTAQWERNSYKLTWDIDIVNDFKMEFIVLYEAPILRPDTLSKKGYTFAGWTPDVAETMPAEDVTYTATWTINQYSISYDLAGGTLTDGVTNPTSYTIESEDITLVPPTREGYTFEGWIGTDLEVPTTEVTISKGSIGDRSYTATWSNDSTTAIKILSADSKKVNVYDLSGRIIRSNVPVSSLNSELPTGIYIIDGKKRAITK